MLSKSIELRFEEDKDCSGNGTLIISHNNQDIFFCVITHTEQKKRIKKLVGTYQKEKIKPLSHTTEHLLRCIVQQNHFECRLIKEIERLNDIPKKYQIPEHWK